MKMITLNWYELAVKFYQIVKRIRILHQLFYFLAIKFFIPVLESLKGFHTHEEEPLWFRLDLIFGKHEINTLKLIKSILRPGMVCLDIGAHVGYYSRIFSSLVGFDGKVVAIEPHPKSFRLLQRNIRKCYNISAIESAVADQEGVMDLFDSQVECAGSSLVLHSEKMLEVAQKTRNEMYPRKDKTRINKWSVRTRRIDNILEELTIESVDLVKLDIEGAEILALHGMEKTILRSPSMILVMEFSPALLKDFGFKFSDALDEINKIGFSRIGFVSPYGLYFPDLEQFKQDCNKLLEKFSHVDLVCLR